MKYGEVLAKVVLNCNKLIKKIDMTFSLKKKFPKVKNIQLTVFPNEDKAKSKTLSKQTEKVKL